MKRRILTLMGISVCILGAMAIGGCSGTVGYYYGPPVFFVPPPIYFPTPVVIPFNPVWCW